MKNKKKMKSENEMKMRKKLNFNGRAGGNEGESGVPDGISLSDIEPKGSLTA